MKNPYQDLPATAYWRTAVADPDALDITGLWQPKFPITMTDQTATSGSCFAQHISRAMQNHGFRWMDCEPAPPVLSPESAKTFNYGVFSFRTGNIYTTTLLRQWVRWALEEEVPDPEHWERDGRVFDPLRPQIEPGGFSSVEEMHGARAVTLAAIREALVSSDVFVFTLGLTESWRNSETGLVYSNCPGTIGGEFDAARHVFANDTYPEVYAAMADVIEMAKVVNPAIRFLLTVSPVPLTATASGQHVLAATTYSKSTLRAVAGDLANAFPNVDYFPSYEIITAVPYQGRFFEPNLRSVRPEGVAHVMSQFFAGLRSVGVEVHTEDLQQTPTAPPRRVPTEEETADDVVCEDEILEYYNAH